MNYLYSNDTETFLKEYNDSFADLIREKYVEMYNAEPGQYLYNSWKTSIAYIKNLALKLQNKGIVFEYIIPAGAERADAVLIGNLKSPSITLIEMKGWKTMNILDDYFVRADNKREVNPEYQVLNYEGKIRYSVDGINDYHINSMVILYNIKNIENRGKLTFLGNEQDRIIKELKNYLDPGYCSDDLKKFVTGKYRQNKNLFDAVRLYYNDIKEGAMRSLAVKGYGLFNEQLEPYSEIIDALSSGKTGNFVIHGGPGSGKTLIAMNLLLRSAAMGKQSVLSYRNNRMV
ncbi:DNA/RNA helicase domain-containing protein, partial [Ferroplasma sp.]|uniref:DNA/RNA helicase domain-containing protein n=1 Tax=Ferroplasma sp. TaxID=2591003 RepID=UPI00307D6103